MSERHRYTYISATSNTMVSQGLGRLYGVVGTFPAGSIVRVDDSHRFPAGVLDINAVSSNTIAKFGGTTTGLQLGINAGIVVAVSSNAAVTIEHD